MPCRSDLAAERHRVDQVRVAQLTQRLSLDQPNAFTRQTEHLAGLAQAERLTVLEAVERLPGPAGQGTFASAQPCTK